MKPGCRVGCRWHGAGFIPGREPIEWIGLVMVTGRVMSKGDVPLLIPGAANAICTVILPPNYV